jgi:hypothetical protein
VAAARARETSRMSAVGVTRMHALRHDGRPGQRTLHGKGTDPTSHLPLAPTTHTSGQKSDAPFLPPFDRFNQGRTDSRGGIIMHVENYDLSARGVRTGISGSVPSHSSIHAHVHLPSARSFEFVTRGSPLLLRRYCVRATGSAIQVHDLSIKTRPPLLSSRSAAT